MKSEEQIFEDNLKNKSQKLLWASRYKIPLMFIYSVFSIAMVAIFILSAIYEKLIPDWMFLMSFALAIPSIVIAPWVSNLMDSDKKPMHAQCISMLNCIEKSSMAKRLRDFIVDELHRPIRQGDLQLFKDAYFYELAVQQKRDADLQCKALNKVAS